MTLNKKSMRALILGASGQDGNLLTHLLLELGYVVLGIGRSKGEVPLSEKHSLKAINLCESKLLTHELNEFKPNVIFHTAAVHGSAGFQYEEIWSDAVLVNTISVHTALEYMRLIDPKCKLLYASSSKVFGNKLPKIINEKTEKKADCLYSVTKNTTHGLINFYRNKYALQVSVIFLFNHESKYRKEGYFIPIILQALLSALAGSKKKFDIQSLGFYCDWGCAQEYMNILIEITEKAPREDFVLATGKCFYARDFVDNLFKKYGLDYIEYINEVDKRNKNSNYQVDIGKLEKKLGISPKLDIIDVCVDIVDNKLITR